VAPASDDQGLPVDDALALLAYLVTCAELCTYEPWHYGQLRLIDAAGRLSRALAESGAARDRPWLADLQRSIEEKKELVMWDFTGFQKFLRETPKTVAAKLREEGW
jgi:hypothetical protein